MAARLRVTQMSGGVRYRDPEGAEHNIRLDVPAAHAVLQAAWPGQLALEVVTSEVTFTPQAEINAKPPDLSRAGRGGRADVGTPFPEHMDAWFAQFRPGTIQHDALTLSAALQRPFVEIDRVPILVDHQGRMSSSSEGTTPPTATSTTIRTPATPPAHELSPALHRDWAASGAADPASTQR